MRGYSKLLFLPFLISCLKFSLSFELDDICEEKGLCRQHPDRSVVSCFCEDDNCWVYGDCCRNVKPNNNSIKNIESSCEEISNTKTDVYIANSCPVTWTDENVYSLCKKNISRENYSYILDVPFLSNVTKILYTNIYCARCNNDDLYPNNLIVHLQCSPKNPCDTNAILNSTYYPGQLWWRPNTNSIASVQLKVNVNRLRRCRIVTRKCAESWTESDVADKCRSHVNYVENKEKIIYQNIYCAQCNYENITNLICVSPMKRPLLTRPSFGSLIDFVVRKKVCSSVDEMYDPITQNCQPTFCGMSYMKIKGKCVLKSTYTRRDDLNNTKTMKSCSAIPAKIEDLQFFLNGSVFYNKTLMLYAPDEYEMLNSDIYLICGDEGDQFLYVRAFSRAFHIVSVICLVVSLICLLIHIIVRSITENLNRIAEKNLTNLSISLFIAQFVYIFGMFNDNTELYNFCFAAAILTHYFYLVVFFWMNVIAFDIYCTFRKFQSKSNHRRAFNFYFSYAWFIPLVIVIIAIIADQTDLIPSLQPNYGKGICWISRKNALFIFFALPLALILIANTVFFSLTAYNIEKTVKMTKMVKKSLERKLFFVYVKLFFVMGGTWIFGFAANLTDFELLWYIFILLNASQGFFLFITFNLKKCKNLNRSEIYTKISSIETAV